MTADELLPEAQNYEAELISARRYLHTHPRTCFDIQDTLTFVKNKLIEMGYEPKDCGKAGLVAIAGGKKPAKLLKNHEDEINGTIKLMFQPAEEVFEGSKDMISSGLLKNPDVNAALMIHVMAGMPFETGTAIVSDGGVSAPAADYFTIKIQGKE